MNAPRISASLRALRERPQWQLLAATKAAPILAVHRKPAQGKGEV